jgi:hypothetical protein
MDLKEVFEKLEKVESGADLITAIKTEVAKLNSEAAKHRSESKVSTEKLTTTSKKLSTVLSVLGLEDGEDLEEKTGSLKATLDGIAAKGGKPDEILMKFGKMEKDMKTLQKQLEDANNSNAAERAKRLTTVKQSIAIDALTKGNAANPKEMAKLIMDNIIGETDDALTYKTGDKELSIEDGAAEWLKNNPWAVKVNPNAGSGAPTGGAGSGDAFTDGFMGELKG